IPTTWIQSMKRRVLFLCTGNSARRVLAEATLRAWAGHRFEVFSAGSQPAGTVNQSAPGHLEADGLAHAREPSKSLHDFVPPDSAAVDLVGTVVRQAPGAG